ncbi:GNAT family N-acetyltransferase [Pseudarthrobacter sp. P1]|uniref:GNAT family N-acetyltransferase n=1 Tax=Pseudarthrobacter sp. P1 TaxID=3418418 RepID=UPI003CEFD002
MAAMNGADPLLFEVLMDAAWRAPEHDDGGAWVLRSAGGVTQRANSVWPRLAAPDPVAELARATDWYAARRQPVIFQLLAHERHAALEELLDRRRFSRNSETLVMIRPARPAPPAAQSAVSPASSYASSPASPSRGNAVELADNPSEEWLQLWWQLEGRGGPAERAVAERILAATPSRYATVYDDTGGVAGVGRLAVLDESAVVAAGSGGTVSDGSRTGARWGGIYAMAVRPDARRQGVAAAILDALLADGAARGVADFFLLVTAANAGARELYAAAGFAEAARYHYRQAPLQRASGGC